jgi:hypothetical protein
MNFNKIWTKDRNDQLRQMIKEGKSVDDIRDYFGSLLIKNFILFFLE